MPCSAKMGGCSTKSWHDTEQDSREDGLSLLRKQYETAGRPHLVWTEKKPGKIEVLGEPAVSITLAGDSKRLQAIATLICRAVSLGWCMLNELEPRTANAEPGAQEPPPDGQRG